MTWLRNGGVGGHFCIRLLHESSYRDPLHTGQETERAIDQFPGAPIVGRVR